MEWTPRLAGLTTDCQSLEFGNCKPEGTEHRMENRWHRSHGSGEEQLSDFNRPPEADGSVAKFGISYRARTLLTFRSAYQATTCCCAEGACRRARLGSAHSRKEMSMKAPPGSTGVRVAISSKRQKNDAVEAIAEAACRPTKRVPCGEYGGAAVPGATVTCARQSGAAAHTDDQVRCRGHRCRVRVRLLGRNAFNSRRSNS